MAGADHLPRGSRYQNPTLIQVRQLIAQNNLAEAGESSAVPPANNAEWYYLMGSIAYRKGWMDDARQNFWTACNMDPSNMEYRQAMNAMGMQAQRGAYGGGMTSPTSAPPCLASTACATPATAEAPNPTGMRCLP